MDQSAGYGKTFRFNVTHVLAGVAILFTVLAIYFAVLFDRRQDALSKAARYDLAWTAAQTPIELSRLGQTIGAFHNGILTERDVKDRYELFLSRIGIFESAAFQEFAKESESNRALIEEIRETAQILGPSIDAIDQPGKAEEALRIILAATPKASTLAATANHSGAARAFEDYRTLLHLHWAYSGLTFLLVAAGLSLLVSLSRQNTLLAQTRRAAERAQAQAEIGSQAKTEFLAAMSHEIRTPLHGIIGFTDLILERKNLPADLRHFGERIKISGSALLTVVNDVLDFSKIEAGAFELDPHPFSPTALVRNCDSIIRKLAETKGLTLSIVIGPGLPHGAIGDEPRLRQVLLNLLNNAIKFTPSGKVILKVEREEVPSERLRFTVEDTGIGIPKEKQDRLFQRFSQVDSSDARQFGGTGLGLAISRRLVELMEGEIGFESEPGLGSKFWFWIPLELAPVPHHDLASAHGKIHQVKRHARILMAEDVEINQEIAKAVLESVGYSVDVVHNGAEAVKAFQDRYYDLILMDIQMPGMDGVAATQQIRALEGTGRQIPIVALTANVYREQIASFLSAGLNDHVGKPFKRDELLSKVEQWIGIDMGELPSDHETFAPSGEAFESVLGADLDEEVYRELLDMIGPDKMLRFLERLENLLAIFSQVVRVGTHAELENLANHAHTVVSAAGQIGFVLFSDACRELELACREERDVARHVKQTKELCGEVLRKVLAIIEELRSRASTQDHSRDAVVSSEA